MNDLCGKLRFAEREKGKTALSPVEPGGGFCCGQLRGLCNIRRRLRNIRYDRRLRRSPQAGHGCDAARRARKSFQEGMDSELRLLGSARIHNRCPSDRAHVSESGFLRASIGIRHELSTISTAGRLEALWSPKASVSIPAHGGITKRLAWKFLPK